MFTRVQQMMQAKIDAMTAGDLSTAVSHCDFPMMMRMGNQDMQFIRPSEMIGYLEAMQARRVAAGHVSSTAEILSVELPRQGLFRVWLRWNHRNAEGVDCDHTDMIYHCRERRGQIRVEAAEVTRACGIGTIGISSTRRLIFG